MTALPRFRIGPWLPAGTSPTETGWYVVWHGDGDFDFRRLSGVPSNITILAQNGRRFARIYTGDEPRGDTVRVRVAVGVTADDWEAYGCAVVAEADPANADAMMVREVTSHLPNARVSFIEADVPLPEAPRTVEGEVAQ